MSSEFGGSGLVVLGEITCGEPVANPCGGPVCEPDMVVGEAAMIMVVGIHMEVALLLLIAAILVGALTVEVSIDVMVGSADITTVGILVVLAASVLVTKLEVDSSVALEVVVGTITTVELSEDVLRGRTVLDASTVLDAESVAVALEVEAEDVGRVTLPLDVVVPGPVRPDVVSIVDDDVVAGPVSPEVVSIEAVVAVPVVPEALDVVAGPVIPEVVSIVDVGELAAVALASVPVEVPVSVLSVDVESVLVGNGRRPVPEVEELSVEVTEPVGTVVSDAFAVDVASVAVRLESMLLRRELRPVPKDEIILVVVAAEELVPVATPVTPELVSIESVDDSAVAVEAEELVPVAAPVSPEFVVADAADDSASVVATVAAVAIAVESVSVESADAVAVESVDTV